MCADIRIRPATVEDVPFVAQCVLASVDLYDFKEESIENSIAMKVCGMEDTIWSWKNARIATVGGRLAGCLVSYDGAAYPEGRKRTFKLFAEAGRPMDDTETETGPGEYYIDSVAVKPDFRGLGIGRIMLKDGIARAASEGISKVTLLVECSKPSLREYYAAIGFVPEREINAFGDRYLKMAYTVSIL